MRKITLSVLALMIVCGGMAYATPNLGVFSDTGLYADPDGTYQNDGEIDYIDILAGDYIPAAEDNHGFVAGASGSYLTVFVRSTVLNPFDPNTNIFFLSNAGADNVPLSFAGMDLERLSMVDAAGTLRSYHNLPYLGVLLPKTGWGTIDLEVPYYTYRGQILYTGELSVGDFFFAAADVNHNNALKDNESSPMTSSTAGGYDNPVPEPASLMLLGLGLLGMISLKNRRS